ncbi:type I polyketide synthase [Aspergillus mulundensis]|uniref:Polyketide synthase, putative (JCVI) n=1 Tax=Aspergillus mulundensis TaxID=1810919 RepID=A0A3D8QS61_9EURO|nr:Polyketide synthase, putative (JCVI) [Aspergillus mulundensis]RDW64324.1 Polyketide synthase, putative (JCVI) [Aspergillus mulundensis]
MSQTAFRDSLPEPSCWVDDPIAIIGLGMRLPGSIRTPQQFWEFLVNKRSGRCRVPEDRYNVGAFHGPKGKPGHVCTEYGHFLDVDLTTLDSSFWSLPAKELPLLDPQQRLLMEVIYECLESSGTADYKCKDIGLYVGALGEDWMDIQTRDPQSPGMHFVAGYSDFSLSNRLSKVLGLTGPSMTIRTACSSSMMALHAACQALYSGDCSSAVVGGSNLILSPRMTTTMSELGVLSPTGECRSFDARADGYGRGEAVNAIHIKRLSQALRDGNPIRSVIRSVCINSDGSRTPLFVPSPESHELLIRRCHYLAGISDLSQTAMIECHGTGTKVGDVQEARAVAKVFGELGGILIGSVKPNLGHSEGASALTSMIKMVLALEHQTIPPNINFSIPNPKIPFEAARLRVPVECEPWPRNKTERVGLNGFGIGGANGHYKVLLESARSVLGVPADTMASDCGPRLLVFSGTHSESVKRSIAQSLDHLAKSPADVADASYTLACRRQTYPNRAFAVGSVGSWEISPVQKAGPADLIWVFSGQGAQYPGMGRVLINTNAIAQDTIRHLDEVLDAIDPGRSWTLRDELLRPEASSRLSQAKFSQPCCTAIQIALVDVLQSLNVHPSAVVGHSAGEVAAAYAAGALTADEAMTISYHRGLIADQVEGSGGMMAIGLSRDQIAAFVANNVTIACENSPKNVTISGDLAALEAVAVELQRKYPEVSITRLAVGCAYHSGYMNKVKDNYMERLADLRVEARKLSAVFVSSVTGTRVDNAAELGPEYWCCNLVSPVLFYAAIGIAAAELLNPVFLEIGPHSALSGRLRDIAPSIPYIPTLVRGGNAQTSFLRTAGRLFQFTSLDLSSLCAGRALASLPPYQWHYDDRFWSESRLSRNWRFRQHPHHDILGSKIPDGNDTEPLWRSLIYLDNVPWLRDHIIDGKAVFPRSCYISMAGEAIRQLTGQPDFSLRRILFLEDSTLHDKHPTELLTQFRPEQDTGWYTFTVTSHFEGTWTKLCTGQARGGCHFPLDITQIRPGHRKIKPGALNHAMKRLRVKYGPRFSVMDQIAVSTTTPEATAKIADTREKQESTYTIHPCVISSIFQLFTVAMAKGQYIDRLGTPTYIDEIYVRSSAGSLTTQSIISAIQGKTCFGNASAFSNGNLAISIRNARLSLTDNRDSRGANPHAGARLIWQPDIDAINMTDLIRPDCDESATQGLALVEELVLACIIESEQQARNIQTLPHLAKYHQWLYLQRRRAECGNYDHVPSCQGIASMSGPDRRRYMDERYRKALNTPARHVATAVMRISEGIIALFQSQVESLSLLMADDLLSAIYEFGLCDFADFFRVLAHNRPCMRVLELGAGTGGATATILPAMHGPHGERLYHQYTYTDISSGFFERAQQRFSTYSGIEYRVLDITVDTAAQGFDASYDLIIASNVLHATPNLQQTLSHVKALLKPGGKLFLQELAPTTKWINYIMGTLPGWFLGRDDRPWEPYVSPERWDAELRAAGLSGADAVVHDGQVNAHIISSLPEVPTNPDRRATILCEEGSRHLNHVLSCLHSQGFVTDTRYPGDKLPKSKMVISLLELDGPQLHGVDENKYLVLRDLLMSLNKTPMLWVTRSSQVNCSDPRYAATLGLLRTARRELGLTVATLELDAINDKSLLAVVEVAERLRNVDPESSFDPVLEYSYARGILMVGKLYPAVVSEELLDNAPIGGKNAATAVLRVTKLGSIKSLTWERKSVDTSSSVEDWVEVETRAIGINTHDLLVLNSALDATLGAECAGTIRRVGQGVKNLRIGDRVIVLFPESGAFVSRFITSERLCTRMARDLSWSEGATMPYAFATALYALIDVARLKHGQSVLIQFACNAFGLAAIQICRMIGANTYCTAGSDAEVSYLNRLGVMKEHIFSFKDNAFIHGLIAVTNGRGVDVVLNNTSGELFHTSWNCVAEFGTLVDLPQGDFDKQLPIDAFQGNRSFSAVNVAQVAPTRPEIIQGLLRRCMHHYALGELTPLPVQEFPADRAQDAFRCVEAGTMERVAVIMPEDLSSLHVKLDRRTPSFRSDAIHLIIGGLGGLGRSVSSWMASHGARHFVFFSPSAGLKEEDDFVLELRAQGCRVDLVSGDISKAEDVDALIKGLNNNIPLAGILQASMALEEAFLATMSFTQWQAAFAPKCQGTWIIHNALLKHRRRTDYFLLFSSLSGLIGQTGHANYAAGNAFLDAFVQYRHSLGLPCSAINIGVMEDVGYVSEQAHVIEHFVATSTHTLHERDLHDAIQLAIESSLPFSPEPKQEAAWPSYVSQSQIVIGLRSTAPLDAASNLVSWRRDPRMAVYHNLHQSANMDTSSSTPTTADDRILDNFLHQVKHQPDILRQPESTDLLSKEIGKTLFNYMLRDHSDLDIDVPLTSLGVDSLLGIKLRDWLKRKVGVDINVVQILASGSLRELGRVTAESMAMAASGNAEGTVDVAGGSSEP